MVIHSKNEVLMCKVFPSSLGPVAMRWFNDLKTNSIDSYKQLIQAFGSCFITNTRVPQPLSSLLSLSMREGETLKAYLDRYWEMYNEMDGDFADVAISTFKSGLPTEHGLRKSLMGKADHQCTTTYGPNWQIQKGGRGLATWERKWEGYPLKGEGFQVGPIQQ